MPSLSNIDSFGQMGVSPSLQQSGGMLPSTASANPFNSVWAQNSMHSCIIAY